MGHLISGRRAVVLLAAVGLLLGTLMVLQAVKAPPAEATTGLCNNNGTYGAHIATITPSGSFDRNIYAKVCLAWNTSQVKNTTTVTCLTDGGSGCNIRASISQAKVDHYAVGGSPYVGTLANNSFSSPGSGYAFHWAFQGTLVNCGAAWHKANDFDFYVRLAANGVLYHVEDFEGGPVGDLSGCP